MKKIIVSKKDGPIVWQGCSKEADLNQFIKDHLDNHCWGSPEDLDINTEDIPDPRPSLDYLLKSSHDPMEIIDALILDKGGDSAAINAILKKRKDLRDKFKTDSKKAKT